jgi:glucosamine--fructose-6-phosphate aminotransferase (isomerizing)
LFVYHDGNDYKVARVDYDIMQLLKKENWSGSNVVMGHSRQITNEFLDNQPVVRDGIFVINNGIIVNEQEIWESLNLQRQFRIDSEAIIAIAINHLDEGGELVELPEKILSTCEGTVAANTSS